MRRFLAALATVVLPIQAGALDLEAIVETHVLPGYEALVAETAALEASAASDCTPKNTELIGRYHSAFDAWVSVSHLRFGPSEQKDRAISPAFWPDPRGSTPKSLAALLQNSDPIVNESSAFATVSVAARGFYALEFLLFDPQFTDHPNQTYYCELIRAVANDIAANAEAILTGWQDGYGSLISTPGNDTFRTRDEATQQFFTALSTGLVFTSQARLGRPLGSFDRPRPKRAEARRSGRSLRHVVLSLEATRALAALMLSDDAEVDAAFASVLERAAALDDPVFANVVDPLGRVRVEALQQSIDALRADVARKIGTELGIAAGFNSLDGD